MEDLKKILDLTSKRAEKSEIFYMKTFKDSVIFEADKVENMENSQSEGMALRLVKNKRTGFATSTIINEQIIEKALENSEFGDEGIADFSSEKLLFHPEHYISETVEKIEPASFFDRGMKIIETLKHFDNRIKVNISFEKIFRHVSLLTSSGFCGDYEKNYYSQFLGTQLVTKDDIFNVWNGFSDSEFTGGDEKLIEDTMFYVEHGRNVVDIETGRYPVLFLPDSLTSLLKILCFSLNGYKIFQKFSPLHEKLGEAMFDDRFTMYDDKTMPGGENYLPFDDEGVPARKTVLVEKGIIKNFLLDLKYGNKLNMNSTGNSLRSNGMGDRNYNYAPSIWPATVVVEPGNICSKELIENIDLGLLVKSTPPLSSEMSQNGDFSGTLTLGYKIENGKIAGRVKNVVITGNIYKLLKNQLLAISSDRTFSKTSEYKLPWMLFKDVDVTA